MYKMHVAARDGDGRKIKALIINGADVDAKDAHGMSALHHAVIADKIEGVELLLNHGADVNAWQTMKVPEPMTPLHYAALYNNVECASALIKSGADVNASHVSRPNGPYWTPLMCAIDGQIGGDADYEGETETILLLLNNGADVNIGHKELPVELARSYNLTRVVELLNKAGAFH